MKIGPQLVPFDDNSNKKVGGIATKSTRAIITCDHRRAFAKREIEKKNLAKTGLKNKRKRETWN